MSLNRLFLRRMNGRRCAPCRRSLSRGKGITMDRHDRQLTAETVVRDRQQSATPSYKTVNAQAPDLDETVRRLALAMVAAEATSGCPEASRLWMHARVQHQSPLTRRACAPVRALVLAWFLRRYP